MMKKFLFLSTMGLMFLGFNHGALALPYVPDSVGPLYIKFDNREQLSPTGTMTSPSGVSEANWGIFEVSSISQGDISTAPQNFDPDTQVWSQATSSGEITGIFGNVQLNPGDPNPGFNSLGGSLMLYWDDTPDASLAAATPGQRTGDFTFTNFTDGTFLGQIDFLAGAITSDPNTTITGTQTPSAGGFTGIANSFGKVADVNSDGVIDSLDGLWAPFLGTNYFDTLLGPNTADLKFRNIYERDVSGHPWDSTDSSGNPIYGAQSSDPARAYARPIPEPTTLLLFGTGILGLAGLGRKRLFKNS